MRATWLPLDDWRSIDLFFFSFGCGHKATFGVSATAISRFGRGLFAICEWCFHFGGIAQGESFGVSLASLAVLLGKKVPALKDFS